MLFPTGILSDYSPNRGRISSIITRRFHHSLTFLLLVPATMSAAMRLKAMAGLAAMGAAIAGIATQPSVRDFIARQLGPNGSRNMWRALALVLALLNLKNIPGFWHIRVLRAIIYQCESVGGKRLYETPLIAPFL